MTEQRTPEPGWYPDPAGASCLRWWNGVSWSDSRHALPGAAPSAAEDTPYPSIFGDDEATPGPRRRGGWTAVAAVIALIGVIAVAVVLLGAIASRSQLDTATIEQEIAQSLSASSGRTTTVVCPDEVTIAALDTFLCAASDQGGGATTVEVTQDDDQGNVTWRAAG